METDGHSAIGGTFITAVSEVLFGSHANLSHVRFFGILVRMIILFRSVRYQVLSAAIAGADGKAATVKRRIIRFMQWLGRLLDGEFLRIAVAVREVVRAHVSGQVVLTMDRTTWEFGGTVYNILAAGVCVPHGCIPFYFRVYPKRGCTSWVEQVEFMERVLDVFPAGKIDFLVADREFGNQRFMRWLNINSIRFCLRLKSDIKVWRCGHPTNRKGLKRAHPAGGRHVRDIAATLRAGQHVILREMYNIDNLALKIGLYRYTDRKGAGSLLVLATNDLGAIGLREVYARRWAIETAFKAYKSSGVNIEDTHVTDPASFFALFSLCTIVVAAMAYGGTLILSDSKRPFRHPQYSIYSDGLHAMMRDLFRCVKFDWPDCPKKCHPV